MRSILGKCQIPIAHFQHVWVRIAPEVGVVHEEAVFVGDFGDAGPGCCIDVLFISIILKILFSWDLCG